jgi:hypothetical protein
MHSFAAVWELAHRDLLDDMCGSVVYGADKADAAVLLVIRQQVLSMPDA